MHSDVVVIKSRPGGQNTIRQWDNALKKKTRWTDLTDQSEISLLHGQKIFHPSASGAVGETVFLVPSHSSRPTHIKGLNVQDLSGVQVGDQHRYSGPVSWWHEL